MALSSLCFKLLIRVLSQVLLVEECDNMTSILCTCVLQVLSSDFVSVNHHCVQLPKLVVSDHRGMLLISTLGELMILCLI